MRRRSLLAGLAGIAATSPARAQFNLGNLIQSAVAIAGSYASGEGDEIKMGETYYQDYLAKAGGAYPDRNAQDALKKFAQPLTAAADRKGLPWDVTLVKSDQVNAWALPGGKLAINSALVSRCRTPDELASVVCHEIGHVDIGHGLAQMRNQSLLGTAGAVGKEALSAWAGGVGAIGAQALTALEGPLYALILTGYSREHEYQADAHILTLFQRTGYDTDKADDFFHTLLRLYPQSATDTTSLFSTHPGTAERIARLEDGARAVPRPEGSSKPPGWAELKERFPTPAT